VLVPLAEIAPNLREPVTGKSVRELAGNVDASGVRLLEGGVLTRIRRDVQESRPAVPLPLNRAGVVGVKSLVGTSIVTFDIYADLDARRSGVHMSRFSQDL
jgi:GTP cyclohydrolase IV